MRDAISNWWKRFVVAPHDFSLVVGVVAGACLVVQGIGGSTDSNWTPLSYVALLAVALAGAAGWASRFLPFPLPSVAAAAVGGLHPAWADVAAVVVLATTLPTRLHVRRRSELPDRLAFLGAAASGWFSAAAVVLLLVFPDQFVIGLHRPLGAIAAATFASTLAVGALWRVRTERRASVAAGAYRTAAANPSTPGAAPSDDRSHGVAFKSASSLAATALLACLITSAVVLLMEEAFAGGASFNVLVALVVTNTVAFLVVWQTRAIPPRPVTTAGTSNSSTRHEPIATARWKPLGLAFAAGVLRVVFGVLVAVLVAIQPNWGMGWTADTPFTPVAPAASGHQLKSR